MNASKVPELSVPALQLLQASLDSVVPCKGAPPFPHHSPAAADALRAQQASSRGARMSPPAPGLSHWTPRDKTGVGCPSLGTLPLIFQPWVGVVGEGPYVVPWALSRVQGLLCGRCDQDLTGNRAPALKWQEVVGQPLGRAA